MTFSRKLTSQRGSALVGAVAFAAIAAVGAIWILQSAQSPASMAQKGGAEAQVITTAHAVAALLKQDILTNFEHYLNRSDGWNGCTGTGTIDEFVGILKSPSASCQSVPIQVAFFKRKIIPIGETDSAFALSNLTNETLLPVSAANGFNLEVTVTEINPVRRQLIGSIHVSKLGTGVPVGKSVEMIIDIGRTVSPPVGAACKICRTVAGSECCGSSISFTYLDTTGRIMAADYDTASSSLIVSQVASEPIEPKAVSVKNLATSRTNYYSNSFCIPSIQSSYVAYVMDTATDGSANYYLTSEGNILNDAGSKLWAIADPKLVSIAYYKGQWMLLRYDGAVFQTNTIGDPNSFAQIPGLFLPNADRISSGEGPTNTVCP